MPTSFEMGRRWIERQQDLDIPNAMDAALELLTQMRPRLATEDISPCQVFEQQPLLAKQWAEQVGIGSIANRHHITREDLFDALYFLMSLAQDLVEAP